MDDGANARVLVQRLPNGTYDISSSSLKNVDDAIDHVVRLLAIAGSVAVVAAILACGWVIRRGLHPVDQMVDTATAIAAGDLSRRVPNPDPRTELGHMKSIWSPRWSPVRGPAIGFGSW